MAGTFFTLRHAKKQNRRLVGNPSLILLVLLIFWVGNGCVTLGAPGLGATSVLGVREFSTEDYARIVLILDRETFDFESGVLGRPTRIFIDIPQGRVRGGVRIPEIRSEKSIISRLRFGNPQKNILRFVIDVSGKRDLTRRVFTLPSPHRIVIDVRAKRARSSKSRKGKEGDSHTKRVKRESLARPRRDRPRATSKGRLKRRNLSLAQRFRYGLGKIVLDPAHGGKDPGAVGLGGLKEKDVALDIAFRMRKALRRGLPGNAIHLTRTSDKYVSLPDRTALANEHDADMFVSIHANSAPSRRIHGVETYLLSEASSKRALALSARESGTTVARMSDLQKILRDLTLRSKVDESRKLAQLVQKAILLRLRRTYRGIRDLGVKRGPFYVLLGAQEMPSILVEVAFISNPIEARRLRRPAYRQALAEGIAKGMMRFVWASGYGKARRDALKR